MNKDLISIIVPIYNVEQYLNRCIESLVNQTYTNLEILLIDDGSTDNSGKLAEKWISNDQRIKDILLLALLYIYLLSPLTSHISLLEHHQKTFVSLS